MKLGFFGGSFDPIHHGHLIASQDVRERLGLDEIIFVPSFHSPLKASEPETSPEERVALLRAAIEGIPGFSVSLIEIERGGISYTIETVLDLKRQNPGDELYWIIGADQAAQLSGWCRIEELAGLVTFAAVGRPGAAVVQEIPAGVKIHSISPRYCDISSTEIRERVRDGRSIHFLTPPQVVSRIIELGLYRA